MMENMDDNMLDNEIRILGTPDTAQDSSSHPRQPRRWWLWLLLLIAVAVCGVAYTKCSDDTKEGRADEEGIAEVEKTIKEDAKENELPRIICSDTVVNDVPMQLYTPRGCRLEVIVGPLPRDDNRVMLAVQAADVRGDIGQPAGDFVLNGEVLSKGHSKYGFCSIINNEVTLGKGRETPLLEKAIKEKGYFFRQYSIVSNGMVIDVPPKGKAYRKALCMCEGRLMIAKTRNEESFHDFSEALADIGITEALSLVCSSSAMMWRADNDSLIIENEQNIRKQRLPNENYLLFIRK